MEKVISILVMPSSQLKCYHIDGLESFPPDGKEDIIQPYNTVELKMLLNGSTLSACSFTLDN